ncbi:MAG: malonyl CoA-acyl carrier protein transacylase [Pseudomonadota bacterium]|jgi:[acyl-carrier-protein] S-malonyltransferase
MSKFAFVFPGQGSQAVGMLDGFAANPVVQQTLEQASAVLGIDMGQLIAQGPKESLDLTTNTQPVMLTAAVACWRAWCAAGGAMPAFVAGHSLGEYSALVAAGVLDFADALPLVRFRAQVMQEAVPLGQGGMAVVLGLSDDQVRAVCVAAQQEFAGEVVQAVNFNAPEQVVIAGNNAVLERACVLAKEQGAKRAMKLPVSAPFHSSLLEPASLRLREYLRDVPFSAPTIQVINNVDVSTLDQPDAIRDALVRQASSAVRWVETVQFLAAQGASHVVECGPGKVLSGLTKRIAPTVVPDAFYDQATLERVLAALQ